METNVTTMVGRAWKTVEGKKVDDILAVLAQVIGASNPTGEVKQVHVGTDSQQNGLFTEYVTVIAVLNPGKGGRAFYSSERVPRIRSLRERLLKEVWRSVEVALELSGILTESDNMTVHVDANPDTKFKSSAYVKELTSMVVSQGFKAVLKPDAWAAGHIADHVVKVKIIGRHHR